MGANVSLPHSSGLTTHHGKTVGWELAPQEGLTAWQGDLLVHGWLEGILLRELHLPPHPLQPGGSNIASLARGLQGVRANGQDGLHGLL